MEDLKGQTVKEQELLNERKAKIELEMAEIEPLVQEAKKAVGNIKSSTLSEVRALRAPPPVVKDILEGVLCLMGIQDTSWNSMKSFLAKRGIKEEILSFDARRISPRDRANVEQLLQGRSNSFVPEGMFSCSLSNFIKSTNLSKGTIASRQHNSFLRSFKWWDSFCSECPRYHFLPTWLFETVHFCGGHFNLWKDINKTFNLYFAEIAASFLPTLELF